MAHEYAPSPERHQEKEQLRSAFDLEQIEPDQVADLLVVLRRAIREVNSTAPSSKNTEPSPATRNLDALHTLIAKDIGGLPDRNVAKALDLYAALATHEDAWPRANAGFYMGNLLRKLPEPSETKQQVINLWLGLIRDEDALAREFAENHMSTAVHSDLLDEPTARYLNSQLPDYQQREDWQTP